MIKNSKQFVTFLTYGITNVVSKISVFSAILKIVYKFIVKKSKLIIFFFTKYENCYDKVKKVGRLALRCCVRSKPQSPLFKQGSNAAEK